MTQALLPLIDVLPNDGRKTQANRILAYLRAGNRLTPLDALRLFGCFRLGARVWDLKKEYDIQSEMIKLPNGKRVMEYRLGDAAKNTSPHVEQSRAT